MPFASLARVLPVHGAITSASKNFLGPIGSASGIVYIPFLPAIFSISEIKDVLSVWKSIDDLYYVLREKQEMIKQYILGEKKRMKN